MSKSKHTSKELLNWLCSMYVGESIAYNFDIDISKSIKMLYVDKRSEKEIVIPAHYPDLIKLCDSFTEKDIFRKEENIYRISGGFSALRKNIGEKYVDKNKHDPELDAMWKKMEELEKNSRK